MDITGVPDQGRFYRSGKIVRFPGRSGKPVFSREEKFFVIFITDYVRVLTKVLEKFNSKDKIEYLCIHFIKYPGFPGMPSIA